MNPFNAPEWKEQILNKEGKLNKKKKSDDNIDYSEVEDLGEDLNSKLSNIIKSAPKIPNSAKNMILDASAIAQSEKDKKASELNVALNDVFTKYNKEYGTNLQIDFSSLSRTLVNVSDPNTRRVLELYLSEMFQSIRPLLILHMISKLSLAIDYILDPSRMFGGDMSTADIFVAVEKILQFIQQLEDMKDEIIIKGSNLELEKLSDSNNSSAMDSKESKDAINDFMSLFMKDHGISE
jgi:hypothetical protein